MLLLDLKMMNSMKFRFKGLQNLTADDIEMGKFKAGKIFTNCSSFIEKVMVVLSFTTSVQQFSGNGSLFTIGKNKTFIFESETYSS